MKRISLLSALFAAAIFVLSSCGGAPEHAKYIPSDANVVTTIDVGSIKDKATDLDAVFNYLSGEIDESAQRILNSGLNLDDKMFVFGVVKEDGPYVGGIFLIEDRAKLEATLSDLNPNAEFAEDGEFRVGTSGNRSEAFVLSETVGIFIDAESRDSDPVEIAKSLFSQEGGLIGSNENFENSTDNDYDVALWANLGSLKDVMGMIDSDLEIINEEIDLTDSYASGGIAFNDGSISIDAAFTGGEEASKLLADVGRNYDEDLANKVAGENLVAAAAFGIDLDKLITTLEEKGKADELDELLGNANITRDQLTDIFTGDVAAGLNKIVMGFMVPKELSYSAAIGIKDQEGATAILDQFAPFLQLEQTDGMYKSDMFCVKVEKDAVLIGGWNDFGPKAVNGEAGSIGDVEALEEGNTSLYLDLTKIPEEVKNTVKRDAPYIDDITTIQFSTDQEDNVYKANATINLNSEDNAIKVIANAFKKELM